MSAAVSNAASALRTLSRRSFALAAVTALGFGAASLATVPSAEAINTVPAALTQEDWDDVTRLSDHINDLETMQGRFIQVAPDGSRTEGYFVLHRPGRLLFRYLPPSKLEIVSDGSGLVVRDASVGTHDLYPISQTPLRFLLEERVDLVGDGNVLDVVQGEDSTVVMMQDETPVGRGQIAITMTKEPTAIQQWTVTDPQGFETTVALFEVEYGRPTDPNWFWIDHLNQGR
ncbi:MAG: outer membrane lipoprotein carrier protein LolA [Devosiaceae bacterium]|nr:outer membrane lipoprotein carrier protein LolA [Devosiaceae bacterium MH13]